MIGRCLCLLAVAVLALDTKGEDRGRIGQLTVWTTNGPITGHVASNRSSVVEYLGIPYAQPPVGALRFAPSVRYSSVGHQTASNWVSRLETSRRTSA